MFNFLQFLSCNLKFLELQKAGIMGFQILKSQIKNFKYCSVFVPISAQRAFQNKATKYCSKLAHTPNKNNPSNAEITMSNIPMMMSFNCSNCCEVTFDHLRLISMHLMWY